MVEQFGGGIYFVCSDLTQCQLGNWLCWRLTASSWIAVGRAKRAETTCGVFCGCRVAYQKPAPPCEYMVLDRRASSRCTLGLDRCGPLSGTIVHWMMLLLHLTSVFIEILHFWWAENVLEWTVFHWMLFRWHCVLATVFAGICVFNETRVFSSFRDLADLTTVCLERFWKHLNIFGTFGTLKKYFNHLWTIWRWFDITKLFVKSCCKDFCEYHHWMIWKRQVLVQPILSMLFTQHLLWS